MRCTTSSASRAKAPGIVFNLSVGYDLEGIQQPNMQWFLDQMQDCSEYKQAVIDQVARFYSRGAGHRDSRPHLRQRDPVDDAWLPARRD